MIYVVTHKNVSLNLNNDYVLIGVGNNSIDNEDIHDNTMENISSKNESYCELTALYWIINNCNDDIIGLTHYRRIFTEEDDTSIKLIGMSEVRKILNDYDIILPPLHNCGNESVYSHYSNAHYKKDMNMTRKVIEEIYPEYIETFDEVMNSSFEYGFNMFISKRKTIKEYTNWLFNILFELENRIDINEYDNYQKRVFGFVSERIFNVWLRYNNLKIKELVILDPNKNEEINHQKKFIKSNEIKNRYN